MQDIVIFGTGKIGKDMIAYCKNKYHILFLIDNDKKKWGEFWGIYEIKPPDAILSCKCSVIVASAKYGMEIANQLQEMGVSADRVYLYRKYPINKSYTYDIYPLNEQNLIGTGKGLKEYDLLNIEEYGKRHIKVMIFCTFYSVYAKQLIENMSRRYDDIEFSLVTNEKRYQKEIKAKKLKHIYYFQTMADLKTILEKLPCCNAIQLLWIEREWSYFCTTIRKKTKFLNLNVGGSDFYRSIAEERDYKKNLIGCADRVTAETVGTIQDFKSYYNENIQKEIRLLPFGIEVLDWIKASQILDRNKLKGKFHIPLEKIVLTCGHNAHEEHQHMKMIAVLKQLPKNIKEQSVFVFPMTYPQNKKDYIKSVQIELEESELEYIILTEFMDFQSMAEYALISDIMIHVQTTDQLSSTMLEEMYAGSIVIAGSWLPYRSLHDMGMYFLDVDTIPEVATILVDVVTNIENYKEKCKGNSEIVWNHSSWDVLAPKWRALWD